MATKPSDDVTHSDMPPGFYPFWFWNDQLDARELCRQIDEMAQQGFAGFYMHSRQGLGQPYLSNSFFDCIQKAVDRAAEKGLIANLYDEYPYPSGAAGGLTATGRPEFAATQLHTTDVDLPGGAVHLSLPAGWPLCVVAYPQRNGETDFSAPLDLIDHVGMHFTEDVYIEGQSLSNYINVRFWANRPELVLDTSLPEGSYRLIAVVQGDLRTHKYWGTFPDLLNPGAVAEYFRLTHQRYRDRLGDRLGEAVRSIFTDETSVHWSPRLLEAYREQYGEPLEPRLAALACNEHPEHLLMSKRLFDLRYRLYCDTFEQQYRHWCDATHMFYAGEKNYLRLSQAKYMDIPGCDNGHIRAGDRPDWFGPVVRQNARAIASAAYIYDKHACLCECFHSVGWDATLQDFKYIVEGLLLAGVTQLVPHACFYSTHGLRKHDAPPSFFFQMPYWPLVNHLSGRVDRILESFCGTHIDPDVVILEPSGGLPSDEQRAIYCELQNALLAEHIEFLIVDTDMLESGTADDTAVHLGDVEVGVVILPPMAVTERPLQAWLERFTARGGSVIQLDDDLAKAVSQVRRHVSAPLVMESNDHEALKQVQAVRRYGENGYTWFLQNTNDSPVEITFRTDEPLCEIPLEDTLPALLHRTDQTATRRLYPFETVLLQSGTPSRGETPPRVTVAVGGEMDFTLEGPNLLRLDHWRMHILNEGLDPQAGVPVRALPLVNQLQLARPLLPATIVRDDGPRLDTALPELSVRYDCEVFCKTDAPVTLVMEPDAIRGDWTIRINDSAGISPEEFSRCDVPTPGCLGLDISQDWQQGMNRLSVSLQASSGTEGFHAPLYLAGDFGVIRQPCTLTDCEHRGAFEAYEENHLPFYSGRITYEMDFELETVPTAGNVLLELQFDSPFRGAMEVRVNEGQWKPCLWEPRLIQLPPSQLRAGANHLSMRVYTPQRSL